MLCPFGVSSEDTVLLWCVRVQIPTLQHVTHHSIASVVLFSAVAACFAVIVGIVLPAHSNLPAHSDPAASTQHLPLPVMSHSSLTDQNMSAVCLLCCWFTHPEVILCCLSLCIVHCFVQPPQTLKCPLTCAIGIMSGMLQSVSHIHCTPPCIIIHNMQHCMAQQHWPAGLVLLCFTHIIASTVIGSCTVLLSGTHTSLQCNGAVQHTTYLRVCCHGVHQHGFVPVCCSILQVQFSCLWHFQSVSELWCDFRQICVSE